MSFSIQRAVSDGSMVLLPISIEYFDRSEISVLFDGVVDARQWAWVGTTNTSISFTPAVANLVEVSVRRSTDISEPRHQFSQGAQFTTESLDEDIRQVLHIAQEAKEGSGLGEVYQDLNFHGFKATNMGNGSLPGDAVNHAQMEVHDATIVGYKDAAQASAVAAAASAASINPVQFPTSATPDTFPMSNSSGTGWLYKTIAQLKTLLGLGSAAYTSSTAYQAADADIPTVAASQAEMEAGTESALRSMSPLRVKQAVTSLSPIIKTTASSPYSPAAGELLSRPHGLGFVPSSARLILECVVNDAGYSVGDRVSAPGYWNGSVSESLGAYVDATNCAFKCVAGFNVYILNKSTGAGVTPTANSWKYYFEVVK